MQRICTGLRAQRLRFTPVSKIKDGRSLFSCSIPVVSYPSKAITRSWASQCFVKLSSSSTIQCYAAETMKTPCNVVQQLPLKKCMELQDVCHGANSSNCGQKQHIVAASSPPSMFPLLKPSHCDSKDIVV